MSGRNTALLAIFGIASISQLWAAAPVSTAILHAGGTVKVNGAFIARSAALFDSDSIQTFANSAATITQTGASIVIAPNSTVLYSQAGIDFFTGSAMVNGNQVYSAHVGNASIHPSSGMARYQISELPSNILVTTLEGSILVNDGVRQVALNAGNSITLPCRGCATKAAEPQLTCAEKKERNIYDFGCDCADKAARGIPDQSCQPPVAGQRIEPWGFGISNVGAIEIGTIVGTGAAVAVVLLTRHPMSAGGP